MGNRYVLFQAYGNQEILAECRLALQQLLQHNDAGDMTLVLYTDDPACFGEELKFFNNPIIEILTPELIKTWRGEIDFVHRVKVKILQHFYNSHSGSVVYCDTDTYCLQSIASLFQHVENGAVYMHTNEGVVNDTNNHALRKWRRFLTKNNEVHGKSLDDVAGMAMWNAGVIGLHSNKATLLKEVLDITDGIYPVFPKHTVEQFAFSYVFQKNGAITAADNFIFHYWDLKEYRIVLNEFYKSNPGISLQEITKKMAPFLPGPIMKDKMAYKNLPLFKKIITKKWSINSHTQSLQNNSI